MALPRARSASSASEASSLCERSDQTSSEFWLTRKLWTEAVIVNYYWVYAGFEHKNKPLSPKVVLGKLVPEWIQSRRLQLILCVVIAIDAFYQSTGIRHSGICCFKKIFWSNLYTISSVTNGVNAMKYCVEAAFWCNGFGSQPLNLCPTSKNAESAFQNYFLYFGRFLKKVTDDQYSSITKGSIYHIKHICPITMGQWIDHWTFNPRLSIPGGL